MTTARPTSQVTITRLRSKRSTRTPATCPKKKPGNRRAESTRPTAASAPPPAILAASAVTATKPIQSPRLDTTCANHNRKNDGLLNSWFSDDGGPTAAGGVDGTSTPPATGPKAATKVGFSAMRRRAPRSATAGQGIGAL